jgi:L-rhamnose isomerase
MYRDGKSIGPVSAFPALGYRAKLAAERKAVAGANGSIV